jgi:hypothetical protein
VPPRARIWPSWTYLPHNTKAPEWVAPLLSVVAGAEANICTEVERQGLTSDAVLAALADGMRALGYEVESGKQAVNKVRRPVLFGENGVATVTYEVDAAHDDHGIIVEVEAGRGARGNAAYRDIVRASLILDARFLVLMMPLSYRISTGTTRATSVPAYRDARDMLEAIYASRRLSLPFEGVLLIGY